jgi:hypothetical protein
MMADEIVSIIEDMPRFPTHAHPSIAYNGSDAWIAFEAQKQGTFSVVVAENVFEYHIQPINDEGLNKHPLCSAGLRAWEFHLIENSLKTKEWKVLNQKHWIITFKDETHDIVAKELKIIEHSISAKSSLEAATKFACSE